MENNIDNINNDALQPQKSVERLCEKRPRNNRRRHCEERSDVAIPICFGCFVALAMTTLFGCICVCLHNLVKRKRFSAPLPPAPLPPASHGSAYPAPYVVNVDESSFVPDRTYPFTYFPWKDVMDCFSIRFDSKDFKFAKSCPKCGRASQELIWIQFNSPSWTWKNLCGIVGPLSICPECKIQVEFILEIMS